MKNNKTPLVSIIVPIYNRLPFLGQLIATLVDQNYQNTEIIIVDDGSSDGSYEWLLTEQKELAFILLQQPNQGAYAARNLGLTQAKGDYIAFQDSDDEWPVNHISSLVTALEKNKDIDWIFGKIKRINHQTGETVEASNYENKAGQRHPFLSLQNCDRGNGVKLITDPNAGQMAIKARIPGSTQCALLRNTIFENQQFDASFRTAYDQIFAIKCLLQGFKFAYVEDVHQIYHVHDAHISLVTQSSAQKRINSAAEQIRGYQTLTDKVTNKLQQQAINEVIANLYAWLMSVAYRESKDYQNEWNSLLKAIQYNPYSLRIPKTLLSSSIRNLLEMIRI